MFYQAMRFTRSLQEVPSCRAMALGVLFMTNCLPLAAEDRSVGPLSIPARVVPIREMYTDRPDVTESAYSVAKGMYQLEMSFLDFEREANNPESLESWIHGQVNFKYGIADDADLQLVFDTHTHNRASNEGEVSKMPGFGDVMLRLKQNLWGNESGRTAFAVMPFVTIPTGTELSDDAWAGGVSVPFAMALTDRLSFSSMGLVYLAPDGETNGYDLEFLATVCVGISLTERWGGYSEIIISAGEDTKAQVRSATGLTFAITDDLVLDAGIRIGLNRAAPDLGIFSGMSFRF